MVSLAPKKQTDHSKQLHMVDFYARLFNDPCLDEVLWIILVVVGGLIERMGTGFSTGPGAIGQGTMVLN